MAAAEAEKDTGKLKGGFRLPAGKRCSKGTCDYAHDVRYPGEPCYRDPDWAGPLPLHVHNNDAQRMRIEADRQTEGKRTGKTVKPLVPPAGAAAHAVVRGGDVPASVPPSLMELLGASGFMLDVGDDFEDHGGYGPDLLSPDAGVLDAGSCDEDDASADDTFGAVSPADASGFIDGLNASRAASDAFSTPHAARPTAGLGSAPPALHFSACADSGCGCGLQLPATTTPGAPTVPPPVLSTGVTTPLSGLMPPHAATVAGDGAVAVQSTTAPAVGDVGRSVGALSGGGHVVGDTGASAHRVAGAAPTAAGATPVTQPPASQGAPATGIPAKSAGVPRMPSATQETAAMLRAQSWGGGAIAPPPPVVEPSFADTAGRAFVSLLLVLTIGTGVFAACYGMGGMHVALTHIITATCTRGGLGLARSFAFVSADTTCDLMPPTPSISPWLMFCAIGSLVFTIMMLTEHSISELMLAYFLKVGRGVRELLSPRRVIRRVGVGMGITCMIFLVMMMVTGSHGFEQPLAVRSLQGRAIGMAQHGVDLVSGPTGDRLRFVVNNLSVCQLNETAMPKLMQASDVQALAYNLGTTAGKRGKELVIGDTGAAIHVVTGPWAAVPGSVRPNTLAVKTANGSVVPPLKCDSLLTLETANGSTRTVLLEDALIMADCAHNLVSLGKLAAEQNISLTLGAGIEPSYLSVPELNSTASKHVVPIHNLGVIVIPQPGASNAALGAVAHGARRVKGLGRGIVHARGNHTNWETLKHWHKCTSNVPECWSANVHDEACDDCLKANAPEVSSDRHGPEVKQPGDLVSFDVYSLGVKHVHGGQSKVLGIHDHYSKFNFMVLLRNEGVDEIIRGWRLFMAYSNSKHVTVRAGHTDNGTSFVSNEFRTFFRDEVKARLTTSAPYSPRSNGAIERQWRTLGNATRAMLSKSKLPRNYAWYAFAQATDVNNTLPHSDNPNECSYSLFTGAKPSAAHYRVWGCVAYAKIYNPLTKMADRAVRGVHLGRAPNQSGYLVYEPQTRKMHVSTHVRFVETALPGLTLNADGYESVVPHFSDEHEPTAEPIDESESVPTPTGDILGGPEPSPLLDRPDSPTFVEDDDAADGVAAQLPGHRSPPASVARPRRVAQQPQRLHGSRLGFATSMLALASSAFAALKPGGEAYGTQFLGFNSTSPGDYLLYLCSGPTREGDFAHQVREISAAQVYVINVDTKHGGYAHDLSSPKVAQRLTELAADPRCLGVLATIPCGTWSPARWVQPGPPPLRSLPEHPSGIPDASGRIPAHVLRANTIAEHAIQIAEAAASHGGHYIFENPVGRDAGSQFAITGREDHASLWTLPAMVRFARRHGECVVHFDQCRTGSATQKTTQLLCSPSVHEAVRERLGHLVCDHPAGTHESMVGKQKSDGTYETKGAEVFTPQLNRLLAESMLTVKSRAVGWVECMGSAITPYTNTLVSMLSYVTTYGTVSAEVDETDAASLLAGIAALYSELDDDDQLSFGDLVMHEVAPIAAGTRLPSTVANVYSEWRVAQPGEAESARFAYKVAAVKQGDADNPTYKQAMAGKERDEWITAIDGELGNLKNAGVYVEVPEDSLPSWNPTRKRASELVDTMWVLKAKYNELLQRVKLKARCIVRGDQETAVDAKAGRPPAETFAPTVRHSTVKLLMASGVVRSAQANAAPVRQRSFDITAAFLQGKPPQDRIRYVLPPPGCQSYDRRGIRIVWQLIGNVYGTTTAPRVWNQSLHEFLTSPRDPALDKLTVDEIMKLEKVTGGLGLTQSDYDPCYYYTQYDAHQRLDLAMYVDDGWVTDNAGVHADRDLALLNRRFGLTVVEHPTHFLNMNVHQVSPTKMKLTSEAYIVSMADRYVPNWRERGPVPMPSTDKLMPAYERALLREHDIDPKLVKTYGGKVGALVYTSPCVRSDACATIARLSRALTFPTPELDGMADDCIVYMAQTADLGITLDGTVAGAERCSAESDSDWAVGHSTTGWCCYLANAAVVYASKRQACICMSSTEAEIVAASACAVEMIHVRRLLDEMGLPQETTRLYVDNSGAVELSRDRKSCHRSRHVDRRYFKVRELCFEGQLRVEHIDTKLNSSDLLTKPLPLPTFLAHRKRLMNLEE